MFLLKLPKYSLPILSVIKRTIFGFVKTESFTFFIGVINWLISSSEKVKSVFLNVFTLNVLKRAKGVFKTKSA